MSRLPNELWIQILDYLEPEDLINCQRTSKTLLKLARDSSIWRSKCFEKAPSAVHAFSRGDSDSLTDILNVLSLAGAVRGNHIDTRRDGINPPISRRAKAIVKWDCTEASENIDWLSEYMARHAPLSTEWLRHSEGNEIRSMALFDSDQRILSAMEDGSLRVWDVTSSSKGRRSLKESARGAPAMLFPDLSSQSGPSVFNRQPSVGTAVDSTVVDPFRNMAYVAVGETLNEVDLDTMQLVSQNKYSWNITATSQVAGPDIPLMIGTSFSLQMHDPRLSLRYQADHTDHRLDLSKEGENIVFLDNFNKAEHRGKWLPAASGYSPNSRPEVYAWIEPGPQAILHRGPNEIIVAGRIPSILFYDNRFFPKMQYSIHSGARLSSLTTIPFAPSGSTNHNAEATLIAAGEYHGRGSLELYELPHHRPCDQSSSQQELRDDDSTPTAASETQSVAAEPAEDVGVDNPPNDAHHSNEPFSYRNRQSASKAKILSVATQGARIVFSDGEGGLRWVERDGRGLARRWNINAYEYNHTSGATVGEAVARKLLTFPSDRNHTEGGRHVTRGNGDLLVWTGSDIGIVTTKVKWTDHDELVQAFEDKMHLEDGPARRREQEEQYSRIMRQALERQADERRFLARFGRMGGW